MSIIKKATLTSWVLLLHRPASHVDLQILSHYIREGIWGRGGGKVKIILYIIFEKNFLLALSVSLIYY